MSRVPTSRHSIIPKLESVTDLASLPSISDDVIVSCLRERFLSDTVYTNVGSNALVVVNPHKYIASNADAVLMQYAAEYRETSPLKTYKPPHIFQLANYAYYHMRRTNQDQSILIIGETGSGKSENRRLAIRSILELSVSNPGKKGSKLSTQIPSAEFVLETFGNARTMFNSNASRFGKYTELQFTERGRLSGIKTLDYYLERNRVVGQSTGERNFHIFYYLVAGASVEERQHLHLGDKTTYRYLGHRGARGDVEREDALRFEQLKMALKNIGLSKRHVAQTCQLVAAILHLGNLDFFVDKQRNEDAAVVRNVEVLETVADFLGVLPSALENALSYKTKLIKKELCTVFLDPEGASDNRDDLAKSLYSLLFAWLNESINQKFCRDDFVTFISILDLPGSQNIPSSATRTNSLDQFCVNFANEQLQNWTQRHIFESQRDEYEAEGISHLVPSIPYFDNSECVRLLSTKPGGLIHIMDDQARRAPKKTDHTMIEAFEKRWANHSSFKVTPMDRSGFPTFTVNHFNGSVTYSAEGLLERNTDSLNPDIVSLLRGTPGADTMPPGTEGGGSHNPFVRGLFSTKAIATQAHPRSDSTIVAAQQPVKPMRAPSTRRKQTIKRAGTVREPNPEAIEEDAEQSNGGIRCVAGEFKSALDTLFETLDETQPWYVFCINPNDSQLPNQLEGRGVKAQVRSTGLPEIARRGAVIFEVNMTPVEFCERYGEQLATLGIVEGEPGDKISQARKTLSLGERDLILGQYKVFLSRLAFHKFEDHLRANDQEEQKRNRLRDAEGDAGLRSADPFAPYATLTQEHDPQTPYSGAYGDPFGQGSQVALPLVSNAQPFMRADLYNDDYDDRKSFRSDDDARSRLTSLHDDTQSNFGTESYAPSRNMFHTNDKKLLAEKVAPPGEILEGETTEEIKESSARRRWVALCWLLTWWLPPPFLIWIGRMRRLDVRQAWREKLAINIIIWFTCACAIFVIVFLGNLICPREYVFTKNELDGHGIDRPDGQLYSSIRGEVFDLTEIAKTHSRAVPIVKDKLVRNYAGNDITHLFPVQVSALCGGTTGSVSPYVIQDSKNVTDFNVRYHDFRITQADYRPDWYFETMVVMRYKNRVGFVGWPPEAISQHAGGGGLIAIYNGLVYDITAYFTAPPYVSSRGVFIPPDNIETHYLHPQVVDLFKYNAGQDITKRLNSLPLDGNVLAMQKTCLRNLFMVGKVDNRNSPQCQFASYILLALSIVMVSIIGFKFLAALHFGSPRAPEDHDKFVVCQVPCYTEGEESLRRTIDSLAKLKYDDKRKLLFIICDGMIVGSGNDRPTPRIVLDILGADPNLDPEPLSFLSLGEGAKQHNMGKVYSGLYECAGHVVPYLVLVKVGKLSERSRPGNRGKRDSQMVLMHFLNKVHFNTRMNPLELEMYHQIKNVIGVNPTFYEYLFMVDADTTVDTLSLNRLVSAMMHDKKVLGVCGETELSNSKQSIITMMQVYEYFISHHLAKAFESLFGSVTCLPGCFTMYRLRTPDTRKALFISDQVIQDYSENRVDTLHLKNLLHLGEDRYLTTLLLKHFPNYKTQFVRDAHAFTVAPDEWSVLLSQRRRWINSTVHNLAELVFLDRLCGFCCFSMRFVVFIDLLSTVIQPVSVAYIVYLIYLVIGEHKEVPQIAIIMLAAIYGLQAFVFVFRRKWDMIGWLLFYIIALPVFSLFLPLYAFWRMDDFTWGATRLVQDEKGKKYIAHEEGKFDPRVIPMKSWTDYENELWDKESNHSIGSWVPPKKDTGGYAASRGASLYGGTYYEPPMSRAYSPAPSQGGFAGPPQPLGYNSASGRNTPVEYGSRPGSRQMLHHPSPSRHSTNYLDMPILQSRSPLGEMDFGTNFTAGSNGGLPSDQEIERAVQDVLRDADLNTITKREIRRQLEDIFGVDLSSKKSAINATVDRELLARA